MRKTILLILLSTTLCTYSGKCYGQFFKKLSKEVENISKKLTNNSVSKETSDSLPKMTISIPNKNLRVNILETEWNGDEFLLEFTITNTGEELKDYCLMDASSGKTIAFDDLGNQCHVTILFGNIYSKNSGYAQNTLFSNIPIKVIVTITKFGTKASSFSLLKIGAGTNIWNITNHFIFKNIPIKKNEETEAMIQAKDTNKTIQ